MDEKVRCRRGRHDRQEIAARYFTGGAGATVNHRRMSASQGADFLDYRAKSSVRFKHCCRLALLFALIVFQTANAADTNRDPLQFSDEPTPYVIEYPDWFKTSFLDLPRDVDEALQNGKRGIILYFEQANCGYCDAFVKNNLGLDDIVIYMRRNFDVVQLDIWGEREVTDFNGDKLSEREFSILHNTNFTPSFMFIVEGGRQALLLRGYHEPYRFRAALRYVGDRIFEQQSFPEYIALADSSNKFEMGEMNERDFFIKPPYILARSRFPADRPLLVMFESRDCHACDVMHKEPLSEPHILDRIRRFEVVQLDRNKDTPLITPIGPRTTARNWARRLGIAFTPTLIFFDNHGHEIIRLESVTKAFRMQQVLDYVLTGGFAEGNFQQWRARQRQLQR